MQKNQFIQQSSISSNGEDEVFPNSTSFESNSNTVDSSTTTEESFNSKNKMITAESRRQIYKLICSSDKNQKTLQNYYKDFPNILSNTTFYKGLFLLKHCNRNKKRW